MDADVGPVGSRLGAWMPGLRAARAYKLRWLGRDLLAGLVLSALLVPQGMAYAELAGLPAITGLYTTVVCLAAYAVFGPSPYLVLGPDSSLGPMIAAVVLPMAAGDQATAIALAGMLALMVGAVSALAGFGRLGFVADLLSKPVRIGYLTGLAFVIVIGQLPKLFGFSVQGGNVLDELAAFAVGLERTNPWSLAIGVLALAIVFGLARWRPKWPGLLVAVVACVALSGVLDLSARGVDVVGVLPQGFPVPTIPSVELSSLPFLAAAAVGITLVALGDTISTSAGFAARRGYDVDSDQEMVGIGAANVLAGLFSGFPVSTSSSRTAVAEQAGAKSQLTGVAAALLVLAMLVFAPGIVRALPMSVLAAVVIVAAARLFDAKGFRWLWSVRRDEFLIAGACFLGVSLVGVLEGIVIAVALSILQLFWRMWRPHQAVLGHPDGVQGYHDLERYPGAAQKPGLLMLRWDAPLFFANANVFRGFVRREISRARPRPHWVLIAAEPITDVDTTAADMLVDLDLELNGGGIHLALAELKDPVRDKIERYGLYETIDRRHFFPTVNAAVAAFEERYGEGSVLD